LTHATCDGHRQRLLRLSKEQLVGMLEDAAKNWLAHDGLWFLAAEASHGIEAAMELDKKAWEKFAAVEARRVMQRHHIPQGGGVAALEEALAYRLYAYLNAQEAVRLDEGTLLLVVRECRVQAARRRKGLPDFPCKPVGIVEYATFARTVDARFSTRCITCPPDPPSSGFSCAWEFSIGKTETTARPSSSGSQL
jgi:hypothetical protein